MTETHYSSVPRRYERPPAVHKEYETENKKVAQEVKTTKNGVKYIVEVPLPDDSTQDSVPSFKYDYAGKHILFLFFGAIKIGFSTFKTTI